MPTNPYVIGQWVRGERFYGREVLIEEILHGPRDSLWALGTRRVGKTSLLKQLELVAADSGYFPLFWDFQGAEDLAELRRGLGEALLDSEDRLARSGLPPGGLEGEDLFEMLGRLRRRARAAGLKLLLLCDEVEELIKLSRYDPSVLRKLRRELQSSEDVRSVLASTIRLWDLSGQRGDTSPFLHGFTPPLWLRGLSDDEARRLVRQGNLRPDLRPAIDEKSVEEIRARCDNHPYLIQLVSKRFMEVGDLREAFEQVASDQMVSYFFAVDYEMLADAERGVLRLIAEDSSASSDSILHGIAVSPGELSGTLLRLEQLGYIRRDKDHRFELVNYFFRRWMSEQPRQAAAAMGQAQTPESMSPRARWSGERPPSPAPVGQRTTEQPVVFDARYRLMEQLGSGATGVVYRAIDQVLDETIALKILKPEYCANAEGLERFRREVLLSRDIGHPNILKVYHLGDCRGQKYLAMRLIEGPTLAEAIGRSGALPVARAVAVSLKLASALEAAHRMNVVHRDIKPGNILTDAKGEPYLADFGLARLLDAPGMTHAGVFLGTPDYASPEQASLQLIDARSDIYSLGIVMFEIATGRRPFTAPSVQQVLEMHRVAAPSDPASLRPELPSSYARVILRCMEKQPERRYQSATELRLALGDVGVRE